jgi:hypothetical protein
VSAALAAHEAIDDRGNLGAIAEVELRRPGAALTMLEAARERLLPVGNRLEIANLVCLRGRAELATDRIDAARDAVRSRGGSGGDRRRRRLGARVADREAVRGAGGVPMNAGPPDPKRRTYAASDRCA